MRKINRFTIGDYLPRNLAESEKLSDESKRMLALIVQFSIMENDANVSVALTSFDRYAALSQEDVISSRTELEDCGLIAYRNGGRYQIISDQLKNKTNG